ncbi:unnamed protein product, partial [marine sediment metagenome]
GYFMRKYEFPAAPFLIAMILEPFAEGSIRRFLILSGGEVGVIFTKPIAVVFIILTVLSLLHFIRKK